MPAIARSAFSPLDLESRSLPWQIGAVIAGTLFLTLSSYITVPIRPVPVTMQTFAIGMVGALYGWRLGAITIIVWLCQAALGAPVLAGGAGGAHHFVGATAGYLFAFPLAGALSGWLAERGWNGGNMVLAFGNMMLSNLVCLVLGAAWLATLMDFDKAIAVGVTPFLIGSLLKSALGAATLVLLLRLRRRK